MKLIFQETWGKMKREKIKEQQKLICCDFTISFCFGGYFLLVIPYFEHLHIYIYLLILLMVCWFCQLFNWSVLPFYLFWLKFILLISIVISSFACLQIILLGFLSLNFLEEIIKITILSFSQLHEFNKFRECK